MNDSTDSADSPVMVVRIGARVDGRAEHPDPAAMTPEERDYLGLSEENT